MVRAGRAVRVRYPGRPCVSGVSEWPWMPPAVRRGLPAPVIRGASGQEGRAALRARDSASPGSDQEAARARAARRQRPTARHRRAVGLGRPGGSRQSSVASHRGITERRGRGGRPRRSRERRRRTGLRRRQGGFDRKARLERHLARARGGEIQGRGGGPAGVAGSHSGGGQHGEGQESLQQSSTSRENAGCSRPGCRTRGHQ